MKKEQRTVLNILCSKNLVVEVNWQDVCAISCQQGIGAVIFDEVQRLFKDGSIKIPSEVKFQWFALQRQVENQNIKVNRVLYKVVDLLNKHDIPSVLLKGQGLAQFYKNPLHRQPGDIDIYVGTERYAKAKEVFSAQDWLDGVGVHEDVKHLSFVVDGVSVELHRYAAIIPGFKRNRCFQKMTEATLLDCTTGFYVTENGDVSKDNGIFVATMPLAENVIYTFVHLFRHFIESGVSLRQLMDWTMLLRQIDDVAAIDIEERLRDIGFLRPWQVFGCLLVQYFGFEPQRIPCYDSKYTSKARKVMEMIFRDGENGNTAITHADTFKQRMDVLGHIISNFGRTFNLFPVETCAFSARWLMNAVIKYLHLYKR